MAAALHGIDLMFGWESRNWLAVIFGLGIAAAVASMVTAIIALVRFMRAGRGAGWEP